MVIERTRMFGKNQSMGHNSETKEEEAIILVHESRPDLIHIPIMLHEENPNGNRVMECTRMFGKNQSKGHNSETKKEGAIILVWDTSS